MLEKGIKLDDNKPPMALIDPEYLEGLAEVLAFGAQKYAAHNWRGGLHYSRIISAALRHITAINKGENIDPETGKSHAYHLGCCSMFLASMMNHRPDMDDRYKGNQNAIRNIQPSPTDHGIKAVSGLQIGEALAKSHDYRERGSTLGTDAVHGYQRLPEHGGIRNQQSQPSPSDNPTSIGFFEHLSDHVSHMALQAIANQCMKEETNNAVHPLKD